MVRIEERAQRGEIHELRQSTACVMVGEKTGFPGSSVSVKDAWWLSQRGNMWPVEIGSL